MIIVYVYIAPQIFIQISMRLYLLADLNSHRHTLKHTHQHTHTNTPPLPQQTHYNPNHHKTQTHTHQHTQQREKTNPILIYELRAKYPEMGSGDKVGSKVGYYFRISREQGHWLGHYLTSEIRREKWVSFGRRRRGKIMDKLMNRW